MHRCVSMRLAAVACTLATSFALPASAVDADAAEALAKKNNCFRCHTVDRKKDGPSYKDVAAKYRDKDPQESEQRLITHITTGEKAKFPDGHEEDHKIVKAKTPDEVRNLVQWVLSR